jgi:hypothetical protein
MELITRPLTFARSGGTSIFRSGDAKATRPEQLQWELEKLGLDA